jgi:hypothetical protein
MLIKKKMDSIPKPKDGKKKAKPKKKEKKKPKDGEVVRETFLIFDSSSPVNLI